MKIIKTFLLLLVVSLASATTLWDSGIHPDSLKGVENQIQKFIEHNKLQYTDGVATMYTNFLVGEKDAYYAVDFLLSDKGELMILNIHRSQVCEWMPGYKLVSVTEFPMATIS